MLDKFFNEYIKSKKFIFNKYFFCYIFLFFLFIISFWIFSYIKNNLIIANENILSFLISYLLEIFLSIDNVFVWFIIFKSFNIPKLYQRKVLLYGFWGAVILRAFFIYSGNIFFEKWHWLLYLFGIFFIITSLKILISSKNICSQDNTINLSWIYKIFRVSNNIHGESFFIKIKNKIFITPLLLCLITIELSDVMFSLDSIPAIFSITNNLFVIFISNIFAVLGLRFMYLFTAGIIEKFPEMKYALSCILIFLGIKILIEKFFVISIFFTLFIILIIFFLVICINIFAK